MYLRIVLRSFSLLFDKFLDMCTDISIQYISHKKGDLTSQMDEKLVRISEHWNFGVKIKSKSCQDFRKPLLKWFGARSVFDRYIIKLTHCLRTYE